MDVEETETVCACGDSEIVQECRLQSRFWSKMTSDRGTEKILPKIIGAPFLGF